MPRNQSESRPPCAGEMPQALVAYAKVEAEYLAARAVDKVRARDRMNREWDALESDLCHLACDDFRDEFSLTRTFYRTQLERADSDKKVSDHARSK